MYVRNGTETRRSVSVTVVDEEDTTLVDETLTLDPNERIEAPGSPFRQVGTYAVTVDVEDGDGNTYEWDADRVLHAVVADDGAVVFMLMVG
jgi:hypothetical protein